MVYMKGRTDKACFVPTNLTPQSPLRTQLRRGKEGRSTPHPYTTYQGGEMQTRHFSAHTIRSGAHFGITAHTRMTIGMNPEVGSRSGKGYTQG